jgi:hypothetical protein
MPKKSKVTLPGTVEKIIPSVRADKVETAEISVGTQQNFIERYASTTR